MTNAAREPSGIRINLFMSGKIATLEVKNRIIQAPMGTYSYDAKGIPSQQTSDYFADWVKRGVGLARPYPRDIDRAWEAVKGARSPRLHLFISTSDIHLKHQLKKSQNDPRYQIFYKKTEDVPERHFRELGLKPRSVKE
jgi:hypothetical protein